MRRLLARRWPWIVSTVAHGAVLAVVALNLLDARSKAASVPAQIEMALSPEIATPTIPQPDQLRPVETSREVAEVKPRPEELTERRPEEVAEQRPDEVRAAEAIPLAEPMAELAEIQPVIPAEAPAVPWPPPKPLVKPPAPVAVKAPPSSPAPPIPAPPTIAPAQAAPPPAVPAPPQLAALPPAAGRPGADADYLASILAWLERHKEYPREAQRRRQQGTAVLAFELDRQGRVLSYRIKTSSGFAELDREVEAMIKRAEPMPPMPADMTQAKLELQVPVQFRLR
jgi:protein TonB